MQVQRLPPSIIAQYSDGEFDFPVVVYGGLDGNHVLGCGGLCWTDGRCWLFLDVLDDMTPHAFTLFRHARRVLKVAKQLGETEVFVYRDDHPNSTKLLSMLGFVFVEMFEPTAKEIWICRV